MTQSSTSKIFNKPEKQFRHGLFLGFMLGIVFMMLLKLL